MANDEFDNRRADKAAFLEVTRTLGIQEMIRQLGDNPNREGLQDTPRRVIKAWQEMCSGYNKDPRDLLTTFSGEGYDEMVCVGPIKFYSTCEHHLLPFTGEAWVAYIPNGGAPHSFAPAPNESICLTCGGDASANELAPGPCPGRVIGLSKLPRLVEIYSRRLQNQERLTKQIADSLMELLRPKGAACLMTAQHFCMMARGVRQQTASMTTSALRGVFMTQDQTRAEFLALTRKG